MRPAACHRGLGFCGGIESRNDRKVSKRRGRRRREVVGNKPGLDLDLVGISPFPKQGRHCKRRDRLLKTCLLPNWRTRRTGRNQMENERHLVLDVPCSWLCFVSSSARMSLPLMHMPDRQCAVACMPKCAGFLGGDPPDSGTQRIGQLLAGSQKARLSATIGWSVLATPLT